MNLGETYLVTENGNERLGKQKLDLVVLLASPVHNPVSFQYFHSLSKAQLKQHQNLALFLEPAENKLIKIKFQLTIYSYPVLFSARGENDLINFFF